MDWSGIFAAIGVISGIGTTIVGSYIRSQRDEIAALREEAEAFRLAADAKHASMDAALTNFRVEVAREYVTHTRLESLVADLKNMLGRIETKLDNKADK